MSLSRSVVEIVGDVIALCLGDMAHAGASWQILSQQSVEVFIAAALPGVIRRGEVHGEWEALFEERVIVKLRAIVQREALEVVAMTANRAGGRVRHFVLGAAAQLFDNRVAGLALD